MKKSEIKHSQVLKPLFQDENAIKTALNSSSETKVLEPKEPPASVTVEPVNPKIVFREKMRVLRREYRQEYLESKQKQQQNLKQKEEERLQEYQRFKADVERYRKEQEARLDNINYDPDLDEKVPMEALQAARNKRNEEIKKKLKQRRYENHLKVLEDVRQKRLEHLVHLFHESKHFVTYSNMDYKIDEAFSVPNWIETDIPSQLASKLRDYKDRELEEREKELRDLVELNSSKPGYLDIQDFFEEKNEMTSQLGDLESSIESLKEMAKNQQEKLNEKMIP